MEKFIISEEEKSRILEMHETATNRYYLNENTVITEAEWYNAVGSVIGIFDPTGLVDFINGISYLSQGDMFFGLLSMISVVPYIGDAVAKPLMLAGKGSQVVKNTNSALQFAKSGDVAKATGLLAKVGSTNSLLGKFISSVGQWAGKLKQMIQKTPASKMSNGLKTILSNIVLSFEKAATKLKSIVTKPKPIAKPLVATTGGYSKTIPESVKLFLQKRPNIKVNDVFFNTINKRKGNISSTFKDIKKLGQVNAGRQTKLEFLGADVAITNLKNMSETISKNKNFNLKSFMENAYRARYEINDIQKRLPRNESNVWNNLGYIKDSIDILIKDIEKIIK
jgi:hypothetical protein